MIMYTCIEFEAWWHIYAAVTGSSFGQVMDCRLLGAKPLSQAYTKVNLLSIWPLGTNVAC